MSARNELAKDIDHVLFTDSFYGDMFRDGHSRKTLIDVILTAGYTKPRTITTTEELAGLAQGAKLYSTKTTHSWTLNDISYPNGGTKVQGTGGGYTYLEDFIKFEAPLTILHEPEA